MRRVTSDEYENIPPHEKNQAVQTMHLGILQNSGAAIRQQLEASLALGKSLSELAMVMMHVSEAYDSRDYKRPPQERRAGIMPSEIREACDKDGLEVAVFAVDRLKFAQALHEYQPEGSEMRPYDPASDRLQTAPSEGKLYGCVFAVGMCTIIEFGYKPQSASESPPQESST